MMVRYPAEFKPFAYHLHRRGFKIQVISEAIGASTRTVWRWILEIRGSKLSMKGWQRKRPQRWGYRYMAPHLRGKIKLFGRLPYEHQSLVARAKEAFMRLLRWLYFRDKLGGYLDLEACLRGEEPP